MATTVTSELKSQKNLLLAVAGLALAAIVVSSSVKTGVIDPSLLNNPGGLTNTGTNTTTGAKNNRYTAAPTMQLKTGVNYFAVVTTNYGKFTIDLLESNTPYAVNNFVFLAKEDFYDNLSFHRIVKGTLLQGGDPLGDSQGTPGYRFKDEIDAVALGLDKAKVKDSAFLPSLYNQSVPTTSVYSPTNLSAKANWTLKEFYGKELGYVYSQGYGTTRFAPYVVAYANGGPNTNGSQFFITTKTYSNPSLDGKYTIFGRISAGFDVIDAIESQPTDSTGKPGKQVIIQDVQVLE